MSKSSIISKDFSFNFENNISIGETSTILKEYYSGFADAFSMKKAIPIFLDTNILLNYYGMSMTDKTALKAFFEDKITIIHITQQIEKEFQRNRISTIQDYFDELKKIKTNFKSDLQEGIKNKFNNIFQSKIVEKDFPEILEVVKSIYLELENKLFKNEALQQNVNSRIDSVIQENKNLEYLDPILEIYKQFTRLPNLSEEELVFLQKSYSDNFAIYSGTNESTKKKFSFPGCGEKKGKDAHGDYIIFHEIIKFMKDNSQNAIFLTRDVTKSDWLQTNRTQFIHYIEKVYQLTGHYLYIFDATDLLEMISFENIYQTDTEVVEDEYKDNDSEHQFRNKFKNLVNAIHSFLDSKINKNDGDKVIKVENRMIDSHDIDLVINTKSGYKEGIIVYDCASNKKGYKKSLQRRINACNKLVEDGIVDIATVVVSLNSGNIDKEFDYNNEIRYRIPVKIIVGYTKGDNDNLSFVEIRNITLD